MNNYTDELINSQEITEAIYGSYTSPYLTLTEDERAKWADAFSKAMRDEQYIDFEYLHKALDATLYDMKLLDLFNGEGAFVSKGIYGRLKEYPDQGNGVIKLLKKIWAAKYGSQYSNSKVLSSKTEADKEREIEYEKQRIAAEKLEKQHTDANKQATDLENKDFAEVGHILTDMVAKEHSDYKRLLDKLEKEDPERFKEIQITITPNRKKLGNSLFSPTVSNYIEELPDKTWNVKQDSTKAKIGSWSCGTPGYHWKMQDTIVLSDIDKLFNYINGRWAKTAEYELNNNYDMNKSDDYIKVKSQIRTFVKRLSKNSDVSGYIILGKNTGDIYKTDATMSYISNAQGEKVAELPVDDYELIGAETHWRQETHNTRQNSYYGGSINFDSKKLPRAAVEKWGFRYKDEGEPTGWGYTEYQGPVQPAPLFQQECNADTSLSYRHVENPTD